VSNVVVLLTSMDKKNEDCHDVKMKTPKEESASAPIHLSSCMKKKKEPLGRGKGKEGKILLQLCC
jgi:hypothetical protein